jgi:hypothetical protein
LRFRFSYHSSDIPAHIFAGGEWFRINTKGEIVAKIKSPPSLRGLKIFMQTYPALKRWANFDSPYGTQGVISRCVPAFSSNCQLLLKKWCLALKGLPQRLKPHRFASTYGPTKVGPFPRKNFFQQPIKPR